MKSRTVLAFLGVSLLLGIKSDVLAQGDSLVSNGRALEQQLEQVNALLHRFQNDSALYYLQPLLKELEAQNLQDAPLGLKAQLVEGIAAQQENEEKQAIKLLNQIKDKSKAAEQWDTYVEACLQLAKLHENLYRKKKAAEQLAEVREVLQQQTIGEYHHLLFTIQMTSWHQIFGHRDSAYIYATEALQSLDQYDRPDLRASWYNLMATVQFDEDYKLATKYYQDAAAIYKELKDYINLAYSYRNLTEISMGNQMMKVAKLYNDSSIQACYWAIISGHERIFPLHDAYQIRGHLFQLEGVYDSAYYYTKRGLIQEIKFVGQQEADRIIEIEERYQNEQKTQQINAQAQEIKFQRQSLFGLLAVIGIILLFAFGLIYYYARLRKANRLASEQAAIIKDTNQKLTQSLERQLVLQGEIHHRVKNNLQVIISLLELQKEDIEDEATRESLEAMSGRIFSMAALHDVLYQKEGDHLVDFLEYTKKLCDHLSDMAVYEPPLFNLQIPKQLFTLETLMPLGIILNELLTNSLKYASQKGKQLLIDIQMQATEDGFLLNYKDNGPGFSEGQLKDREGGLGAYLLRSMSRQLKGKLESRNEQGAAYSIFFQEKNRFALN